MKVLVPVVCPINTVKKNCKQKGPLSTFAAGKYGCTGGIHASQVCASKQIECVCSSKGRKRNDIDHACYEVVIVIAT